MKYLTNAIVIIVVSIILRYLFTLTKKQPVINKEGEIVLKYPGFVGGIGYFVIGFGVLIGIIGGFHLVKTTGDEVLPYLVLFFVVLGLPMVLMSNNNRVLATNQKIQYTGITKKVREIRWDEIRKVTFSFTSELVLQSELIKIKLNIMLAGFENFVEFMKPKLDPALYEKALQAWEKAVKNMERR